jgi:hypothetical protein
LGVGVIHWIERTELVERGVERGVEREECNDFA